MGNTEWESQRKAVGELLKTGERLASLESTVTLLAGKVRKLERENEALRIQMNDKPLKDRILSAVGVK